MTILEMADKLDENPRATHYGSPAMYELNRAGVGDDLREEGFKPNGVSWRKLDGTPLVLLNATVLGDDPDRMVCLPLNRLGKILRKHVMKEPNATILFDHKVVGLGQDESSAWVDVETPDGSKRIASDYIVGCDGANSQIRRSLFGDWEFPGRSWNEQIVATNVSFKPLLQQSSMLMVLG